jgi:hypothetical protein
MNSSSFSFTAHTKKKTHFEGIFIESERGREKKMERKTTQKVLHHPA